MGFKLDGFAFKEHPASPEVRLARFLSSESTKTNEKLAELQQGIDPARQVTVGEDFRIQPPEHVYDERDREYTERVYAEHHPTEDITRGDLFEQFITAVLLKRFKGRYIVTRASKYDDYKNGVDNFLVDVKTGGVVCALDEINLVKLANTDPRFQNKKQAIHDMNWGKRPNMTQRPGEPYDRDLRFGAMVKYGLILKPGSPDGKTEASISCGPVSNIPIFLISLDSNHIEDAIDGFEDGVGKPGSMEDKLYRYFLANIQVQIDAMKSKNQDGENFADLPEVMQTRIDDFEVFIKAEFQSLSSGRMGKA